MQKPQQKRMLQDFVRQFTDEQLYHDLIIVSKNFYEVTNPLKKITDAIDQEFFAAGDCLGHIEKGRFVPSIALLLRIAAVTIHKTTVTDQAAWLFVCGRDVLDKSVVRGTEIEGLTIVLNKNKEVLGYGELGKPRCAIRNYWDIGDFLRRER